MAPLPDSNTGRLYLDYTSASVPHTLIVRFDGTQTAANLQSAAAIVANHMAQAMVNSDSVFAARASQEGQEFSLPVTFTSVPGVRTLAGNIWTEDPDSAFYCLTGRSNTQARRWKLLHFTIYNFGSSWPVDNRYSAGENATVDAVRTGWAQILAGQASMPFPCVAIDAGPIVMNAYANIAKNAYRQRKQRG